MASGMDVARDMSEVYLNQRTNKGYDNYYYNNYYSNISKRVCLFNIVVILSYILILLIQKKIVCYTILNPTWVEGKKYKCQQFYSTRVYFIYLIFFNQHIVTVFFLLCILFSLMNNNHNTKILL